MPTWKTHSGLKKRVKLHSSKDFSQGMLSLLEYQGAIILRPRRRQYLGTVLKKIHSILYNELLGA